jgi:hypothetical protein
LRGAPPAVTAEDARRITLITLAARTSAQTGAPVTVSPGDA